MYNFTLLLLWILIATGTNGTEHSVEKTALKLTPMIRAGHIIEARKACKVEGLSEKVKSIESYSGHLTVDDIHNSNLFFWFFPAMNGAAEAPVLLWLQGGPGIPSLYGLFEEHGPFSVSEESGTIELRNHTWVSTHSMLYVDNPVNTGYSFSDDDAGYSKNQTEIGRNMYEALLQFFTMFPEYQKNDFYVTGESYAGKYVPAVSYVIHKNNPNASLKINLKGMAIGNGLIDPKLQALVHGETRYQRGFIDDYTKNEIEKLERSFSDRIDAGDFKKASILYNIVMMVFDSRTRLYTYNCIPNTYNTLSDQFVSAVTHRWVKYLNDSIVRTALHVIGNQPLKYELFKVLRFLEDHMQSVSPWLSALLDDGRYRVLLYSGQFDLVVPYSGTVSMARSLRWSGAEHFKNATRTIWRVRGLENTTNVAGYATSFGPLTLLLVRNAGHMVPVDQPARAHEMITRFTSGEPFQ
ncbi:Serine carboxypeptidase, serine active site,Serine carboxypeptidases, histidine active [Cinara cedri]|uniref:Carboxypeptidase n=1 Tax=Cinara cedri TaxID=506608 RepID=A0A5E4MGY8_9HEMI|nr:Serine carboxypeptidase, serine active site,Serine carboxypeptidases, histidine active [Cinara cedri]